jgi:hypothetical protein
MYILNQGRTKAGSTKLEIILSPKDITSLSEGRSLYDCVECSETEPRVEIEIRGRESAKANIHQHGSKINEPEHNPHIMAQIAAVTKQGGVI